MGLGKMEDLFYFCIKQRISMNNQNLLTICKASAGSGKTFTLAVNYITLVVMNPEAYRKILAVTFTNKATGEMKDRILSQLYGIAQSLPSSDDCLDAVMKKLGEQGCREDVNHRTLDERQVRANAGEALTSILHNYSFFRIETIDSFMLSILRNMAKELQLGHNMDIELDQKEVIHNGVHDLIKDLEKDSHEMSCILHFILESIDNEKHWDVRDKLEHFASDLYREAYLRHSDELNELLQAESDTIAQLRNTMEDRRRRAEERIQEPVKRFFETAERIGASGQDFAYGTGGPWGFFNKLRNGECPDITSRTNEYAQRGKSWAASKTPLKDTIKDMSDEFSALLSETIDVYTKQLTEIHTAQLVLGNLHQLQLMGSIDNKIKDTCRESNRFLLADTCLMLKRMNTGPSDTSFIYEKTGTEYDHLLIDEFQDTSGLQWENFRPLLEENTARGRHNLIVGDVKQSIYRWRDSDARIMSKRVGKDFAHVGTVTETLGTNYRSRENIVQFNNQFFQNLVKRLADFPDECDSTDIADYYQDIEQAWKADHDEGYVDIRTAEVEPEDGKKATAEELKESMCRTTVETIVELLDAGLKQSEIAILTRENKDIALLATWIASHPEETEGKELRIVSGEAFQLGASEMLALLVSALRWLVCEDDVVSLLKLGHAWHNLVAQDDLTLTELLAQPDGRYGLPEELFSRREELTNLPLTRQLYTLCDILRLTTVKGHDAWLQTFFDVAQNYVAEESGDTREFLDEWDERLSELAIPSGGTDGIQAMTIHKSKGLEFHTVVVPFCDWKLEKKFSNTMWIDTDDDAPQYQDMPCLPINRNKDMKDSAFKAAYREETKQIWIDNLNLLYVAFTRPTANLIVIRSAVPTTLPPEDVSAFIDFGKRDLAMPIGTLCTKHYAKRETQGKNPLNPVSDTLPAAFHSSEPKLEFRQSNSSRTYINRGDDSPLSPFIEQGNLLHEVFAHIRTAADAPAAVEALFTQGIIDAAKRDEIAAIVGDALQQENAKAWFDGHYTLFNECTILTADENGTAMQQRPDRVMTDGRRTIVVDFKFGQHKKAHETQVRSYMTLLTRMGYPQVEGYLWYVLNKQIVPCQ